MGSGHLIFLKSSLGDSVVQPGMKFAAPKQRALFAKYLLYIDHVPVMCEEGCHGE